MDNESLWDQIFQNQKPAKEVSASLLAAGQSLYEMHCTFISGGFTEDQSLTLVAKFIHLRMREEDE